MTRLFPAEVMIFGEEIHVNDLAVVSQLPCLLMVLSELKVSGMQLSSVCTA